MTDESNQAAKTYDSISAAYAETFSEPSDHIDDFLGLIPKGGKVLDAGCGPGVDSAYMSAEGFRVIGVELSPQMLELAREKSPDAEFQLTDIREIGFDGETFDGVLASYSLIHLPKKDVPGIIGNFFRILKSGGAVCIGIQEGKSAEVFLPEPLKPAEKMFLNVMSAEELKELVKNGGFKIMSEFTRPADKTEVGEFDFNKFALVAQKAA
ncbi:MAG: class I SAM-dependent methyltransferase [bacterium]|nr:class I SAM-dependent methyltransferase [bacterium]MDZ4247913.1 class I SAM-dependent methyltransferase [Patescibacteria group bacterium]